jgi:uncharacterized protein YjaZ
MARRTPRGLTIVAAYRLIGHYAEEALGSPNHEHGNPLDGFHSRWRTYIRRLLSGLDPALIEIGERWAASQTGDPDLNAFIRGINAADAVAPRSVVETALVRCSDVLPHPDLMARVILLLGDGESRVLTELMQGVTGVSLGSRTMMLFFWPVPHWPEILAYTASHEYIHLVRNYLFPRSMVDGRMVYVNSEKPDTLLDAMLTEGLADAFAEDLYPDRLPRWLTELSPEDEAAVWPQIQRSLRITDPGEIRRYLFGDSQSVPLWSGHAIGYGIVKSYLRHHPNANPASLVGLQPRTIYEESGYERPHFSST